MMAHGPPEAPIKSTQQLLDWTGLDWISTAATSRFKLMKDLGCFTRQRGCFWEMGDKSGIRTRMICQDERRVSILVPP